MNDEMPIPTPGFRYRWGRLRSLGNSPAAKVSIAIPLVGYFIIFNNEIVDFLRLHSSVCADHCAVSWRLIFLYFGGSALGVAAAIYSFLCPLVIKQYASAAEFLNAENDYFSAPRNMAFLVDRIYEYGGHVPDKLLENIHLEQVTKYEHWQPDILGRFYLVQNYRHWRARLTCYVLIIIGFALIAVPTVLTFVQVLVVASERVLEALR